MAGMRLKGQKEDGLMTRAEASYLIRARRNHHQLLQSVFSLHCFVLSAKAVGAAAAAAAAAGRASRLLRHDVEERRRLRPPGQARGQWPGQAQARPIAVLACAAKGVLAVEEGHLRSASSDERVESLVGEDIRWGALRGEGRKVQKGGRGDGW
jgi:hypothetical protein